MKNGFRSIVHVLVLTCGFLSVSSAVNAALIFEDDFESGNLNKWTIGGRQLAGTNIANTVNRYGSTMGHLYKYSFTEITLENTFTYDSSLNFMLDIEVTSNGSWTPPYFGYSGVSFYFYDSAGGNLGTVTHGTSSTNHLSVIYAADPALQYNALTEGTLLSLDLGVSDILTGISIDESSIDTVLMQFKTYSSTYPQPHVTAELWVDNVCVDQGDVCGNTGHVPEPTTLALMGLGLAGIGWKRRKAA